MDLDFLGYCFAKPEYSVLAKSQHVWIKESILSYLHGTMNFHIFASAGDWPEVALFSYLSHLGLLVYLLRMHVCILGS